MKIYEPNSSCLSKNVLKVKRRYLRVCKVEHVNEWMVLYNAGCEVEEPQKDCKSIEAPGYDKA